VASDERFATTKVMFTHEALRLDELTQARAAVNVCVAATRSGYGVGDVSELLNMLGLDPTEARALLPEIKRTRLLAEERYATANGHQEDE